MQPYIVPKPTREPDPALDAATEWILSELDEPASLETMRAIATREQARPRDWIHRRWAEVFLAETARYGAQDSR